jgi:hypothetical protein
MLIDRQDEALGQTDGALLSLLHALRARGYAFVTPGNPTLRTVRARAGMLRATGLRDVFGWSLPFGEDAVEPEVLALMRQAGVIVPGEDGALRSSLRVSSLGTALLLHSGYPTSQADAVFFGPDTYRYAAFLRARMPSLRAGALVVDVGTGSGAGAIAAGLARPQARIMMTDINPAALRLARINAAANGVRCELRLGSGLEPVAEPIDLVIANPPFIADRSGHLYRDGGDAYGSAIPAAWAQAAMARLAPGGHMLLYTGAPVVDGVDLLQARLQSLAAEHGCALDYQEIDPDIFGAELRRPAYDQVERIAAVGAVMSKAGR